MKLYLFAYEVKTDYGPTLLYRETGESEASLLSRAKEKWPNKAYKPRYNVG